MKKIILSAASLAVAAVASVSVAPTTSEAIPAFARQTGSACLACHFQSFPTLTAYGRAFKMGALTDVGDQALVEDEGLSIPSTINWTAMVRPQFQSVDTGTAKTNSIGFADQVFMVGGRGGEHTGVFIEFAAADVSPAPGAGGGQPYANAQMFNSWDMGDMKVGATIWADGFGEDSGLQLMSVWGQHGGMLGGKALTINGAMAGDAGGVGVTGWAGTDTWAAQLAMVDIANQGGFTLSPVLRGNYFLEAGDWEVGLGLIAVTGSVNNIDTKRTGLDVQAFGEVGDMQIGVFADYATAPSGGSNIYNPTGTDTRTGYSFRGSVKPTHNIIVLAGIGQDKTGAAKTDKTLVGVEWEAYQNFAVSLSYDESKVSGGATTKTTLLDFELLI